jgi:hypothetical protein
MTHGIFLSVAAVATILVAVLVLAVLSSLVFLGTDDDLLGRHSVALFWMCLAVTWLLAVVAAVAIQSTTQLT